MFEKTVGSIKYGQSMPETWATLGTSHREKTTHKTKKRNSTVRSKNGVNPGARKRQTVPASYKTPAV